MNKVHILDEIVLDPDSIDPVLQLLKEEYLPGLAARQTLSLLQRWLSPPVQLEGRPNTLWLLWEVSDLYGYYTMRGTADEGVLRFWESVDKLCRERRRHVMTDATQPLPKPLEDA